MCVKMRPMGVWSSREESMANASILATPEDVSCLHYDTKHVIFSFSLCVNRSFLSFRRFINSWKAPSEGNVRVPAFALNITRTRFRWTDTPVDRKPPNPFTLSKQFPEKQRTRCRNNRCSSAGGRGRRLENEESVDDRDTYLSRRLAPRRTILRKHTKEKNTPSVSTYSTAFDFGRISHPIQGMYSRSD